MANSCDPNSNCDNSTSGTTNDDESLSNLTSNVASMQIRQNSLESRIPTKAYVIFENASAGGSTGIYFREYVGTRSRNHGGYRLYLPQVISRGETSNDGIPVEFSDYIQKVLSSIPYHELSSYVVSVRTGVSYFFSKRFQFNKTYSIDEIQDLLEKKISTNVEKYYYLSRTNYPNQPSDGLRSTFCTIKPISQTQNFVERLLEYGYHVQQQKHVFRIYLQSEDKQTHVCTVDPALNYSIVEFSKDFQRASNIDFIRDRQPSKFKNTKTYDDIFDFRVQFQYNPRTCSDQMDTIAYELRQQFPSISPDFKNEHILRPCTNDANSFEEYFISKDLCKYIHFIRRDVGDVYQYKGEDDLFENFTIFLESSDEYFIDHKSSLCKRQLDTHGIVYAKLNLETMLLSSNSIDQGLLVEKLWNMGNGLTILAGKYTTPDTQQSTIYYTHGGDQYTAQDEALVQKILKRSTLHAILELRYQVRPEEVERRFKEIISQLGNKWHCFRNGFIARDKLNSLREEYMKSF